MDTGAEFDSETDADAEGMLVGVVDGAEVRLGESDGVFDADATDVVEAVGVAVAVAVAVLVEDMLSDAAEVALAVLDGNTTGVIEMGDGEGVADGARTAAVPQPAENVMSSMLTAVAVDVVLAPMMRTYTSPAAMGMAAVCFTHALVSTSGRLPSDWISDLSENRRSSSVSVT